jgi:sarcosine oxidase
MRTRADVVVIGAGAMGSATAWQLARRGRDVVLLEQFDQGHVRGSSHGGARIFRYAYPEADYVNLAIHAEREWRALEADADETLLDITGGLDHGVEWRIDEQCATYERFGLPYERLSPHEAEQRWPAMRFDRAVVYQPGAGRCRADASVAALQRRTAALGGDVRFGVGSSTLAIDGERAVVSGDGWTIETNCAVVTAGAWVSDVLAGVGATMPAHKVTQEQTVHFRDRRGDDVEWPSFIHHEERIMSVYGLRTIGEGIKVGGHGEGPVVHPDRRTFDLSDAAIEERIRYVDTWFPGLDPTPINGTTCLYTTTHNEDFVLDRVGPIVIGSPCSGHGFKFTPAVGALLADLVDGKHHDVSRWMLPTIR